MYKIASQMEFKEEGKRQKSRMSRREVLVAHVVLDVASKIRFCICVQVENEKRLWKKI